jgi:hypothetical protein
MGESSNELIIDPQLLVQIRRQCWQRAAELEAAQKLPPAPILSEAERFATAVLEMPANVRRFFDQEDLVSPRISWESDEERTERERLTALGGWCG